MKIVSYLCVSFTYSAAGCMAVVLVVDSFSGLKVVGKREDVDEVESCCRRV